MTLAEQNALVEQWLGLVPWAFKKWKRIFLNSRVPKDDLFQAGRLGLVSAARTYDAAKGIKFPSYASMCIYRAMLVEHNRQGASRNIRMKGRRRRWDFFMDSVPSESPEPSATAVLKEDVRKLRRALHVLPEREREAVRSSFGFDAEHLHLREIAARWGLTINMATYEKRNGLARLREAMAEGV